MKKQQTKKVKAWAILNKKGKLISLEMGSSKPTRFTIGTWMFFMEGGTTAVPCEIIYKIMK